MGIKNWIYVPCMLQDFHHEILGDLFRLLENLHSVFFKTIFPFSPALEFLITVQKLQWHFFRFSLSMYI